PEPADSVFAESAVVQGAENWNWFEATLAAVPPGPEAATRASYMTPGLNGDIKDRKPTRILPSDCGEGLPRLAVVKGDDCPDMYTDSRYSRTREVPSLATREWSAEGSNSTTPGSETV